MIAIGDKAASLALAGFLAKNGLAAPSDGRAMDRALVSARYDVIILETMHQVTAYFPRLGLQRVTY